MERHPTQSDLVSQGIDVVYITRFSRPNSYLVYGFGKHVWNGHAGKLFLGKFDTLDDAKEAFPFAKFVD